jgi:hypothetical protein
MSNAELLTTVIKQAGTGALEAEQLAAEIIRNGNVLALEWTPQLDVLAGRMQQAATAALELQNRARGNPPVEVGN